MQIHYKDNSLERVLIGVNVLAAGVVVASFVLLFGFDRPLLPAWILYTTQVVLLCVFVAEKIVRLFNAAAKAEFWRANWYEIPLLLALAVAVVSAGRHYAPEGKEASIVRHFAVGVYLVVQVVAKLCRTSVDLAASGKNPTQTLIASFLVLTLSGAGLLMLPAASAPGKASLSFADALFTATSAACVTGLSVKDAGQDFSVPGQVVILALIQLGGLGIVVFGAVFALLLGQALSLRESVAMQDLLSAGTLSRIGNMIAFVFVGTIFIEAVGAASLFHMWADDVPHRWFCSIFHSVSAFCNAGIGLFRNSFVDYRRSWQVYVVICPLIILGGLGFSVLYDLANMAADRMSRVCRRCFSRRCRFAMEAPKRMRLQTKIVLTVSTYLILLGALAIFVFDRYAAGPNAGAPGPVMDRIGGALFQSVTARTAGFNTIDISAMSASGRFVLILLMLIGGSPGGTAGGIKTVTLAVVIGTAVTALLRRQEVEMFRRSVRPVVVGRAVTVTLLFVAVFFVGTLTLSISENSRGFSLSDVMFETASALGTVGLSTGITPSLTIVGKLTIITMMVIGRLGPLTLLAALTFNLKPAKYNYPDEAIMVG